MSEQKRYTAQEMREAAGRVVSELYTNPFADMLRQAADAEDKLKLALVTICNQSDEIAKLKALIEAVVKECEKQMKKYDCGECNFTDEPPWTFERCEIKGCPTRLHAMEFLSILRAARGEGGAE